MSRVKTTTKPKSQPASKAPAKVTVPRAPKTAKAPKPTAPTAPVGITVMSITPQTTANAELNSGVSVAGMRGEAKTITVHATFNGMAMGVEPAIISGSKWTCDFKSSFSPPGTLIVTALDDTEAVHSGTGSLSV